LKKKIKVDNPYSVTFLIKIPMFEWCVGLVVAPRTDIKKASYVKDWAACSKYYNHLGSIVNIMGDL
jgi:hypothetical protein